MSNNTQESDRYEPPEWGFLVFIVILMLACIICNGLILVVFSIERTVRNQTNIFVVSLACADLVVGLISMPLWIAHSAPHTSVKRYIYMSIDLLCCSASIVSCALLSMERALKITCPYWYTNTVTMYRVRLAIMLGWIAALLVGGLSLARVDDHRSILYISFISLVIYIIPVIVIVVSYISIFVVARKHSQSIRRISCRINGDVTPRLESDAKTAWRLGIFIAVFVICWTPIFIGVWADALKDSPPVGFSVVAATLPYLNTALNPFLYALANPVFRKGIKKLKLDRRKRLAHNTIQSGKRTETSIFYTNMNNSPSISRTPTQFSPKSERREIALSLLKHSAEVICQEGPPEQHLKQESEPITVDEARKSSMWETSM